MTAIAVPVIFLAFANDRDDRARYLHNLDWRAILQASENPFDAATLERLRKE